MIRFLHYMTFIIFLAAFSLMLTIFYWMNYPYKVIEFKKDEFSVITKKVQQGGLLRYTISYCRTKGYPLTVSRSFVDGIIFTTPSIESHLPEGCHKGEEIRVPVPTDLPAGVMHLDNIYTSRVNPLRTVSVRHKTETFEILEMSKEDKDESIASKAALLID